MPSLQPGRGLATADERVLREKLVDRFHQANSSALTGSGRQQIVLRCNLLDCPITPQRLQRHLRLETVGERPSLSSYARYTSSVGVYLSSLSSLLGPTHSNTPQTGAEIASYVAWCLMISDFVEA